MPALAMPTRTPPFRRLGPLSRVMEIVTSIGIVLVIVLTGLTLLLPDWTRNLLLPSWDKSGRRCRSRPLRGSPRPSSSLPLSGSCYGVCLLRVRCSVSSRAGRFSPRAQSDNYSDLQPQF